MRRRFVHVVVAGLTAALFACAEEGDRNVNVPTSVSVPSDHRLPFGGTSSDGALVVHSRLGSPADDQMGPIGPGIVLLGGGPDVDSAFHWMRATIAATRHTAGDVVVLRANDDDSLAQHVAELGVFNSVQTLTLSPKASADDLDVVAFFLSRAEGVIIASDDASEFLRWRTTALVAAVQGVFDRGGVVAGVGGGASILGQFAHDTALASGAVQTSDAIANPFGKSMVFVRDTFRFPQLEGFLVDAHFRENDRFGRLAAFMARQVSDGTLASHPPRVFGIGVDQGNAVVIDRFSRASLLQADGVAGGAYVLTGGAPEQIKPGLPLVYRDIVVARMDSPGEAFDLDRGCGTAFMYRVSVQGGDMQRYAPIDPYEAAGVSNDCKQ